MPRHNKEGRLQGRGGCDTFYAVRSYVRGGNQYCDITNPDASLTFFDCIVMNGQANKINAPSQPWNNQDIDERIHPLVIAMYRSLGRNPIVLGRLGNSDIEFTEAKAKSRHDGDDEDVPTDTVKLDDVMIANDGSKVVLKAEDNGGDMVLSPKRSLKMQLPPDGIARISRDGEASDGPVLAGPYSGRDREIVSLLRQIVAHLDELSLVTYEPGAVPLPTFTGQALADILVGDFRSAVLALSSETED